MDLWNKPGTSVPNWISQKYLNFSYVRIFMSFTTKDIISGYLLNDKENSSLQCV